MEPKAYVLGLNFAYHELSACLLKNGQLIAAAEEERFTRIKHGKEAKVDNPTLPVNALQYCLEREGLELKEIDYIALAFNPPERLKNIGIDRYFEEGNWGSEKGEQLFYTQLQEIPAKLNEIAGTDLRQKIKWIPHHVSHASSSYLASPFEEAAILSVDGIGEIASTWFGHGAGNQLRVLKEISYPHSLGFVWEKMSKYLGFSEYDSAKLMGLSAYGDPERFYAEFKELMQLKPQGEFTVNNDVFQFRLNNFQELENHFGVKKINTPAEREKEHEDIAASLQKITNELLVHFAGYLARKTGSKNLCMAGGVTLNCVANVEIMRSGLFENIYIQPAAHDAGTALGAALYLWNHELGNTIRFVMGQAYWGPEFSDEVIESLLQERKLNYQKSEDISTDTAKQIAEGKIVGWFQGRMEWGPRALGNRSLLADPRNPDIKSILNERIKRREPFRPFAPSVLEKDVAGWFIVPKDCDSLSTEFMEFNFDVQPDKQSLIPAVVHVDGTSRIQLVRKRTNEKYHQLISEFKKLTGVPLILNTSFNDNEPIVCTPEDAVNTFQRTKMDYLAIGSFLVQKE